MEDGAGQRDEPGPDVFPARCLTLGIVQNIVTDASRVEGYDEVEVAGVDDDDLGGNVYGRGVADAGNGGQVVEVGRLGQGRLAPGVGGK
jgi:hypothetical protein